MRSHQLRNWLLLAGLTILLLVLDQGSKVLVRQNLAVGEAWAPIPALSKIFTVTHVRNTGVAFGQLPGLGWVFMLINFLVLIGGLVLYPRIPAGQWQFRLAAPLILAGDLGNVIDRLRTAFSAAHTTGSVWTALPLAYVTDFFDVKIWPVWNVADMCVVTGVTILAWTLWQAEKAEMAKGAVTNEPMVNDQ